MPNTKNEMNHNLSTQTIEKINHIEYAKETVNFFTRDIEYLRNNTKEEVQYLHKLIFCIKDLIFLDEMGVTRLKRSRTKFIGKIVLRLFIKT